MTSRRLNSSDKEVAATLAKRYGINSDEVLAIADAMDQARGMLTSTDLQSGLSAVIAAYIEALEGTLDRLTDPAERAIAERFAGLVVDQLAYQLQSAGSRRN